MFKKFLARLAERKRARDSRARQAAVCASLRLEVLEDRLTPAPAPIFRPPVEWQGARMGGTDAWNQGETWVQGTKPQPGQVAYFNLANATPYLTALNTTISQLTVRGGGKGDTLPGPDYTTTLDLKGKILEATSQIQVLSAAGTRVGNTPADIAAGAARSAGFSVTTSAAASILTTGTVNVGIAGQTVLKAGKPADVQNIASMGIGSGVTLKVATGTTPGDVFVGGATVGGILVEGTLTARDLRIGGVGVPTGTVSSGHLTGTVDLTGSITVGAKNGYTGAAERRDENGAKYVPQADVLIDGGATVTASKGGMVTNTSVQIGDYTAGLVTVSAATLTAVGIINVGNANLATGKGNLHVQKDGVVTSGGIFTINKNGTTTLESDSTLDLEAGGTNKGVFKDGKGANIKTGPNGMINKGTIQVAAVAGAPNAAIAMQGDFTQQADGHLAIQIAGNAPGVSYDQLRVSALDDGSHGNVTLGGTLDVSTTYTPRPWLQNGTTGDYFTVASATQSLSGQFDPLTGLNLPAISQFTSLPALLTGHAYRWRVIYDTTDAFDSSLVSANPAFASQPWTANGTRDAVVLLEEVNLPDLVITSARPSGTNAITVGYRVDAQAIGATFNVSVFTSTNGVTLDTPNSPLGTVAVPGAAVGNYTVTVAISGQTLSGGNHLIAVVDSGNTVAEASEANNAIVLGELSAPIDAQPESSGMFHYMLTLAKPSSTAVTVNYATQADTAGVHPATSGQDYTPVSGSVTFAPGETQKEIDIPLAVDAPVGWNETFLLHFSSPVGAYFLNGSGAVTPEVFTQLTIQEDSASIGDLVWNDLNRDGIQNAGEPGFANAAVYLHDNSGAVIAATQTDANGHYLFTGLTSGSYSVEVDVPYGYSLTGYHQGTNPALDSDFDPVTTLSDPITLTVGQVQNNIDAGFFAMGATTTSLSASSQSSFAGQPITFTALVSPSGSGMGTPGGTVSFFDGTTLLGTSTLGQGMPQAAFTTALAVGSHSVTAVYNGSTMFTGSTSNALTETVSKATDMSWLTASSSSVQFGHPVTFTDTVSDSSPLNPSGTVSFYDNGVLLAVVNLNQMEQALLTLSNLSVGSHTITATYSGDANFTSSTATFLETVYA